MARHLRLSLGSSSRRRAPAVGPPPSYTPGVQETTAQVFNSASPNFNVTLPGRTIGDRLILFVTRHSSSADPLETPFGWTELTAAAGTSSSFHRAYWTNVTAGNVGDTVAGFFGGTSAVGVSLIWRLSSVDPTVAPVANATIGNVDATSLDPASLSGPNGGAVQRNLWIAYVGTSGQNANNGSSAAVTAWPASYTNINTSTTTNAVAANGCGQGWASRVAVLGSDDPSAWTYCPAIPCRAYAINVCNRGVFT